MANIDELDAEFQEWLAQEDLFEYYKNNPDQQGQIYDDYRWEKEAEVFEGPDPLDNWLIWMSDNRERAEERYPLIMEQLTQRIRKRPDFKTALLIQRLPDCFSRWKYKNEELSGLHRVTKIQGIIDLLKVVLTEYEFTGKIIQSAVESVRPVLTEQLEYWEREIKTELKKNAKQGRPKTDSAAYKFENLFMPTDGMNKLLTAAVHVGLIERTDTGNGYRWIEVEGEKGHRVRAFWQVAFESGLIKKGRTNEVKIADSIRVFFGIEKIEEKVLKRENIYHKTYKKNFTALKNEIDKLLKNK